MSSPYNVYFNKKSARFVGVQERLTVPFDQRLKFQMFVSAGIWGKVMEHVLELPCSSSSESEIEAEHKHAKNSAGGRATVV